MVLFYKTNKVNFKKLYSKDLPFKLKDDFIHQKIKNHRLLKIADDFFED